MIRSRINQPHEQERLDILLIYDISSSWHIYFGAHPPRRSTWADVSSFDVASDIEPSRETGFIHSVTGAPAIAKGKNSAKVADVSSAPACVLRRAACRRSRQVCPELVIPNFLHSETVLILTEQ